VSFFTEWHSTECHSTEFCLKVGRALLGSKEKSYIPLTPDCQSVQHPICYYAPINNIVYGNVTQSGSERTKVNLQVELSNVSRLRANIGLYIKFQ